MDCVVAWFSSIKDFSFVSVLPNKLEYINEVLV